jgi:hypothetical protein
MKRVVLVGSNSQEQDAALVGAVFFASMLLPGLCRRLKVLRHEFPRRKAKRRLDPYFFYGSIRDRGLKNPKLFTLTTHCR